MSDPTYSFLPWLRTGVANSIPSADGDAAVLVRATLPLDLDVTATKLDGSVQTQTLHRDVSLVGPADIIGIEARAIIKVDPRDHITNFEPNYLPYIEFYEEDFPWRYTPAAADVARNRLRPWIALVVLREDEFVDGRDMSGKPLAYFELAAGVDTADVFPPATQMWAWAHVHGNLDLSDAGDTSLPGVLSRLQQALAANPDVAYSRIVCPRHLEPDTRYHAFLIPTFEGGRLAGLGTAIPDTLVATTSAWGNGQKQFPYYTSWYFRTGDFGDFDYLVRLLQPRPADARVGVRDMDVAHPGANLPPIVTPVDLGSVLKLGGALRVPYATLAPADKAQADKFDQWDQPFPHPFETAMARLVNLADDYARASASTVNPDGDPDPVVTSPLYGRWPALVDRVLLAPDGTTLPNDQNWVHRLNLDPRFRVAGGLGTRVIQAHDQAYMAAAWSQIGAVLAANNRLRFAQMAQAASLALHAKHIATLEPARQFLLTAPMHARVMGSPTTVAAQLRASVVPPAVTSGVFRRVTRQGTPLMKRLALPVATAAQIIQRINAGELHPAPRKVAPTGAVGIGAAAGWLEPPGEPGWLEALLRREPWLRFLPLLLLLLLVLLALPFGVAIALGVLVAAGAVLVPLFRKLTAWSQRAAIEVTVDEEAQTPASVDALPTVQNFVITRPGTAFTPQAGAADSAEAVAFKSALRDAYAFTSVPMVQPARTTLDLPLLTSKVVAAIDPRFSIPNRVRQIIHLPAWIVGDMVQQFTPVMAYPVFDVPMYRPLHGLSAELFLPNINLIAQNSITLLESNQRFIEAYMVGLNHEMARELLWNEFPTDQRGSYFRQFWDVSLQLPPQPTDAQRESLRDIPPLHRWPLNSALGTHDQRDPDNANPPLVLVIRGDLLKRYPTAVIYAQKAQWHRNDRGVIDTSLDRLLVDILPAEEDEPPQSKIRKPLFEAKVDPDIYFLGFDLSAPEARGGTTAQDDAGWFFVIKERPGEPRFGMEEATSVNNPRLIKWDDLEWGELGVPAGGVVTLGTSLPLTKPWVYSIDGENRPDDDDAQASWNAATDASELAYILYRVPVLVAVHASRMLPPEATP